MSVLTTLLLGIGHDDAVVMLRMLQVILGQNGIAGRLRIAGERHVFFRTVMRRAAHFHIGPVRFPATREGVLLLAVATTVISAATLVAIATTPVLLLSWPHGVSAPKFHEFHKIAAGRSIRHDTRDGAAAFAATFSLAPSARPRAGDEHQRSAGLCSHLTRRLWVELSTARFLQETTAY